MASDVISGLVVDQTGSDVAEKFDDSRSNRLLDIRAAHFVMDERITKMDAGDGLRRQNAVRLFASKSSRKQLKIQLLWQYFELLRRIRKMHAQRIICCMFGLKIFMTFCSRTKHI